MDWLGHLPDTSDRGLSPVVGTAILVVIVVLLAALIGSLVTGVGIPSGESATVVVELSYDESNDQLTVHHAGGETLGGGTLVVRNESGVLIHVTPTGFGVGETVTRNVSTSALEQSDRLTVVWDPAGGSTSGTVLASTTPSKVADLSGGPPAHRNETIYAVDPSASVKTTHVVSVAVESGDDAAGGNLDGVRIAYDRTDVSDVSNASGDIEKLGVDTDGDGDIDENLLADISSTDAKDDGHTLVIDVDPSNYDLEAGDRVIVRYADVQNPSAGSYSVDITLDYEIGDPAATGTLEIGGS